MPFVICYQGDAALPIKQNLGLRRLFVPGLGDIWATLFPPQNLLDLLLRIDRKRANTEQNISGM